MFNHFQICGHMNSYSDACMAHVADNIEKIYSYIGKNLNKEVCQPLGFCDAKVCVYYCILATLL